MNQLVELTTHLPATTKKPFEYKRLSASMMKTWITCPRKFHLNYIDRIEQPPSESFSLGNAVHYALERANIRLVDNPKKLSKAEIEDFVQDFRSYASGEVPESIPYMLSSELFTVGEELVRDELLSLNYKERVLSAEQEFEIITPEGVPIYGFIDKIVEVDSSTIKVVDYKTSKNPLSYDEAKEDEQLSMYELVAAILFPQYPNRQVELRYLRDSISVTTDRSPTAQWNFRKRLLSVHNAITAYVNKVAEEKLTAPKGNKNPFCSWCAYKGGCAEHKNDLVTIGSAYSLPEELDDTTFIDLYKKVSSSIKELESLKEDLKLWAMKRIESNPDLPIEDGQQQAYSLSKTRKSYAVEPIFKALPYKVFKDLVTINNEKMGKYLATLEDDKLRSNLEKSITVKFNNPELRLKKANK